MRRRITAFLMGTAVVTATLTAGSAAMAAEPKRPAAPVQRASQSRKPVAVVPKAAKQPQGTFPSNYMYTARVFTGNVAGGGTSANTWVALYGSDNRTTSLSTGNSHQPGVIKWFDYNLTGYLGRINRICVYRNNAGASPDWYLGSVWMNGTRSAEFYQWIPASSWTCKDTQVWR